MMQTDQLIVEKLTDLLVLVGRDRVADELYAMLAAGVDALREARDPEPPLLQLVPTAE